jgi:site-specific DNA recombinase
VFFFQRCDNAKPIVPKPQRCAIYTRKSTEHNLDLEFNSLDAQREAFSCFAGGSRRVGKAEWIN